MSIGWAMDAIVDELDKHSPLSCEEVPARLPGHDPDDVNAAVAVLELQGRIIVRRETKNGRPSVFKFSSVVKND